MLWGVAVRRQSGPADRVQAPWAVDPVRGAVDARRGAERPFERLQPTSDVGLQLAWGHARLEPVVVCVKRNQMAPVCHLGRELWPAVHLLSDHEEGGLGAGTIERLQYRGRPLRVGAVVECERDPRCLRERAGKAERPRGVSIDRCE